jgi:amino acid transporter
VIPAGDISFTTGVMQAFDALANHFGVGVLVPVIAVALAVGALAGMISWLDGPSEGLLRIGREQGFLPPYFQRTNKHGTDMRILAAQGTVITIIALAYAFIPGVSQAYWIFAVMATQVYLIMYVLMFLAAARLRRRASGHVRGYRAPLLRLLCVLGVASSVAAIGIGFVPPSQFADSNPLVYGSIVLGGVAIVGLLPPLLLDRFRKPGWTATSERTSTATRSDSAG